MNEFKIGDIITGKPHAPYLKTTDEAIMCVTEISRYGEICVKILEHKYQPYTVGQMYSVKAEYFVLYSEEEIPNEPDDTDACLSGLVRPSGKCRSARFSTKNECVGRIRGYDKKRGSYAVKVLYSRNPEDVGHTVAVSKNSVVVYNYDEEYSVGLKEGDFAVYDDGRGTTTVCKVESIEDGMLSAFEDIIIRDISGRYFYNRRVGEFMCKKVPEYINRFWLERLPNMRKYGFEELVSKIPESPAKKDIYACAEFLNILPKTQEG